LFFFSNKYLLPVAADSAIFLLFLRKFYFMGRKDEYKLKNEAFFEEMRGAEGVGSIGGILYRVVNAGDGKGGVRPNSVVTVHYRGTLIDGREFDNS
jgi:peptidylprolyl isomerase